MQIQVLEEMRNFQLNSIFQEFELVFVLQIQNYCIF